MKCISTLVFMFCMVVAHAQQPTGSVKRKNTTADGKPAENITIVLKGTAKGTVSDKDGYYEITNIKTGSYTLEASIAGLKTQSVKIGLKDDERANAGLMIEEA